MVETDEIPIESSDTATQMPAEAVQSLGGVGMPVEDGSPATGEETPSTGTKGWIYILLRSGSRIRMPYEGLSISGKAGMIAMDARTGGWIACTRGTVLLDENDSYIMDLASIQLSDAVAVGYREDKSGCFTEADR